MTAVVDSSPFIVLGKVRRLDLLSALYEHIVIPPARRRASAGSVEESLGLFTSRAVAVGRIRSRRT